MSEHNQHWRNPETGESECECCCKWALDYEVLRNERDQLLAQLAALQWRPITKTDFPTIDDEVGGWIKGVWRSQNVLTAVEQFGTTNIDWSSTLCAHQRPLNAPKV